MFLTLAAASGHSREAQKFEKALGQRIESGTLSVLLSSCPTITPFSLPEAGEIIVFGIRWTILGEMAARGAKIGRGNLSMEVLDEDVGLRLVMMGQGSGKVGDSLVVDAGILVET